MLKFKPKILLVVATLAINTTINAQTYKSFYSERLGIKVSADANMDVALDDGKQYMLQNENVVITIQHNPLKNNDSQTVYLSIDQAIKDFVSDFNIDIDSASIEKIIIETDSKPIYAITCIDNNSRLQCIFASSTNGKNSILSVSMFAKEYETLARTIISTITSY